jgi:hypothetical protein
MKQPGSQTAVGLRRLLAIARGAQNTYVGRHWPDHRAMRRDGIGFGLNDGEHEERIRRFLYECQPEFLVQYLEQALDALRDADRLGRELEATRRERDAIAEDEQAAYEEYEGLRAALEGLRNDNGCWCVGEPHIDACDEARAALTPECNCDASAGVPLPVGTGGKG